MVYWSALVYDIKYISALTIYFGSSIFKNVIGKAGKTVIVILNWRNFLGAGLKLTREDFIIVMTINYLTNII